MRKTRLIFRRIVFALLIVVPGCGGHASHVSPVPHAAIPTAVSVSPATIHAASMVRTRILPSSVMTSFRTPKSAVVPVGWTQLPGGAIAVAASTDGSIWVLSSLGTGPDRSIWHYVNGTWTNVPGAGMRIAVGPDGTPWVVNSAGGIYYFDGTNWNAVAGGASDISVGADSSVYVISNQGGNQYGRGIWHYVNGVWSQMPGAAVRVAASWDTGTYPGGITPGGIWVINALNSIYYFNPGFGFGQVPGGIVEIAPTKIGGVFALGYSANGDGSYPIYYNDLSTGNWTLQQGAGVSISANGANVYTVGVAGGIYTAPVTPVQPAVASISFTGPSGDPHVIGSQGTGYQLIGNQPYTFTVTAFDAGGHAVTGPGSPTFSLKSGSSALLVTPVNGITNAYTVRARRFSLAPVVVSITASNTNVTLNIPFTMVQELWVSNPYNSTITAYAGQPPAPIVSDTMTRSSGILAPTGLTFDDFGRLWVSDSGKVLIFSGSFTSPVDAVTTGLVNPTALAFDAGGVLWVADLGTSGPGAVKSYSGTTQLSGTITNTDNSISGLWGPYYLAFDPAGTLWVSNGGGKVQTVTAYAGTTQLTGSSITGVRSPGGIAFDGSGALWVASGYGSNSTINPYRGGDATRI